MLRIRRHQIHTTPLPLRIDQQISMRHLHPTQIIKIIVLPKRLKPRHPPHPALPPRPHHQPILLHKLRIRRDKMHPPPPPLHIHHHIAPPRHHPTPKPHILPPKNRPHPRHPSPRPDGLRLHDQIIHP